MCWPRLILTKGSTPRANENGADQTAVDSAVEKHAVAALRAMQVRTYGDLNTTPLGTIDFWSVPTEAWQHIGRLFVARRIADRGQRRTRRTFRADWQPEEPAPADGDQLEMQSDRPGPGERNGEPGVSRCRLHGARRKRYLAEQATRSVDTCGAANKTIAILPLGPTAQAEQYRRMIEVAVLTDRGLQHLRGLKRLRTLKLINTNITGHGLDCLKDLPALEELDLPLIAFSPDVARVLGEMQSLRRFRYADVTDESLAEFARLSGLEELELFGDSVTDRGAEHLKRLVELRKLSIRGSRFTDQGLQQLAGLPHLEYLDVRYSVGSLSAAGVTQFQTQKPGCQVLFEPAAKQGDPPPVNPAAVPQDKGRTRRRRRLSASPFKSMRRIPRQAILCSTPQRRCHSNRRPLSRQNLRKRTTPKKQTLRCDCHHKKRRR